MAWAPIWHRFLDATPQLCLDLRDHEQFSNGHISHAVCIEGLDALRTRFSTLPARHVPFLIVCNASCATHVRNAFVPPERWAIIGILGVYKHEHVSTSSISGEETFLNGELQHLVDLPHPLAFITLDQLAIAATAAHIWTPMGTKDLPDLLFSPAPVIARVVQHCVDASETEPIALLDLGCGAGRDVTYALVHAQRTSTRAWHATCVDRWRAALDRAAQLLQDHALWDPSPSSEKCACNAMAVADITDDGFVRALGSRGTNPSDAMPLDTWAAAHLPHSHYDIVWLIRFWPRACLRNLPRIVAEHGLIVLSHFVHEPDANIPRRNLSALSTTYDSPPVAARIQPGEISALLKHWQSAYGAASEVLDECVEPVEDGRPVHSLVVRLCGHTLKR